jgi:hypothetical protein
VQQRLDPNSPNRQPRRDEGTAQTVIVPWTKKRVLGEAFRFGRLVVIGIIVWFVVHGILLLFGIV